MANNAAENESLAADRKTTPTQPCGPNQAAWMMVAAAFWRCHSWCERSRRRWGGGDGTIQSSWPASSPSSSSSSGPDGTGTYSEVESSSSTDSALRRSPPVATASRSGGGGGGDETTTADVRNEDS